MAMRRTLPSLTALRVFEAAARNASFKIAAGELHVTEAAVSRQIRLLEADLGVRLFDRLNRGVRLTAPGATYFTSIREAFDLIDASTRRMSPGKSPAKLVLAVDPGFATRWLIPRMSGFRAACPDIEIEIHPSLALIPLPHPDIDAAIFYGRSTDGSLRQDFLFDVLAFPVFSPVLMEGPHPIRTPDDFVHHRLLHEASTRWWERWLDGAGVRGVDGRSGSIYHDSNFVLDATIAGEGVAIGDDCLALTELKSGRLVRPFSLALHSGDYHLIYAPDAETGRHVERFRDWLLQECRQHLSEVSTYRAGFDPVDRGVAAG
jgi:LysR family glycine cleavage system transcriptional activator